MERLLKAAPLPILAACLLTAGLAGPSYAATIIDYGGDVVSSNENLTRSFNLNTATGTATLSFSDVNPLSPAPSPATSYTGPAF